MDHNLKQIEQMLDQIEQHLTDESLNLDTLSAAAGYSKYHLHRMFTSVTGMTVHQYIQRRRLTEAAGQLVNSAQPILEIALAAGYDSQRSFSRAFKAMYKRSPQQYRDRRDYLPIQLKYDTAARKELPGDMILDIQTVESAPIHLTGYNANTRKGFQVIGKCWRSLHKNKDGIPNRTDPAFLIGVNDYSNYENDASTPAFNYIAAAQTEPASPVPQGMASYDLPAGKYVVFTFRGRSEDPLQPVVDYVYRQWFPHSNCRFTETNLYDLVKYGEETDPQGRSEIQLWVPIA